MKNLELLSKLVETIEMEILTTEESALIGGSWNSLLGSDNCQCQGNNCQCSGDNCQCWSDNCQCQRGNNCQCKSDNCICFGNDCPGNPSCQTPPSLPGNPN